MSDIEAILTFIFSICVLIFFLLDYCRYRKWLSIYKKLYSEFGDGPTNYKLEEAKKIVDSYGNFYSFTRYSWGAVPGKGPIQLIKWFAILVFVVAVAPIFWKKFIG